MGLLAGQLFEGGDELAQVRITLAQDATDGKVSIIAEAVNKRGHRLHKVARLNGDDVAGLEHIPEALRLLGMAWLYDDPTVVIADFIRTVKKERRPSPK